MKKFGQHSGVFCSVIREIPVNRGSNVISFSYDCALGFPARAVPVPVARAFLRFFAARATTPLPGLFRALEIYNKKDVLLHFFVILFKMPQKFLL